MNKCKNKAMSWKNKWLTLVGRITMTKVVLLAIPIYTLACYEAPKNIEEDIENILKRFLWEGSKEERKIPLIGWETACKTRTNGGMVLRRIGRKNLVLGAKMILKCIDTQRSCDA